MRPVQRPKKRADIDFTMLYLHWYVLSAQGLFAGGILNMVNHPVFSQLYIRGQGLLERVVGDVRKRHVQRARGQTLIIGAGTGLDLPHLNVAVTQVTLLEPDATMRAYLRERYPELTVLSSPAEAIDVENQRFDTVVSSLVLCSVRQLDAALAEIYRVLKTRGAFLFMEHVVHEAPLSRTAQHVMNPLWQCVGGGCHLNRDIGAALTQSPLTVVEYKVAQPHFLVPIVAGYAVRD
jgi:SAM-dependent methyltransferase